MATSGSHYFANRAPIVLLYVLMLVAGGTVGFFQIFSAFHPHDDEGYLMISVQSFLAGQPLYDQVYTQYGPAYYFYKAALHRIAGAPVTHDAVRMMTIGAWLLATLLCSLFSYRLTRSPLLAAAVFLLTFRSLWMLTREPGHPQELCAVLLALGMLLASFAVSPDRLRWVMPCLGAVAAAILLTKINAGLYFCLALAGATVTAATSKRIRRVGSWLLIALAILVPVCLMWTHMDMSSVRSYAAVAVLSCVSALGVASCQHTHKFTPGDLAATLAGFLLTALLVVVAVLALSTSATAFWDGVVTGPMRTGWKFVLTAESHTMAVIMAAAATAGAIGYSSRAVGLIRPPARFAAGLIAAANAIRLLLVIGVVLILTAIYGNLAALPTFALPWIWLALADPSEASPSLSDEFSRKVVVLAAVFQVLYVYPVTGSHWSIAAFLTVPAVGICAHDVWRQLQSSRFRLPVKVVAIGTLIGYVLIVLQWWISIRSFQASYSSLTAINLPGAQWIRVPEDEAAVLRCVSINLRDNCDTFFSAPGLNSFYFWSGCKPPTDFNPGYWMTLLGDDQKRAIVGELERRPRAWLVYNPKLFEFWLYGGNLSQSEDRLVRYCKEHFEPMVRVGDYDLCVRAGQAHQPLEEAANVRPVPAAVRSHPSQFGLPDEASPNVMLELRSAADAAQYPSLARVVIVDAADGRVLTDSSDQLHGARILNSNLRLMNLPLSPGWNHDAQIGWLHVVPYQAWPLPKDYDYSKVLAGLFDDRGELIAWLPVAIPLGQAPE